MRKTKQMVAVRGGRMGKAEQGMVAEHENGLCGEGGRNGKGRTGNENGRTWNGSLPLTVLISSRDLRY
jgi:hypothetical protein